MTPTCLQHIFEKSVKFGKVCPFFFSLSYNVFPSLIKRYSTFYKMKDTRWNIYNEYSLPSTVQVFCYFNIFRYLLHSKCFISMQSKMRHNHVSIHQWQNLRRYFAWRHAYIPYSSLDPRVLIKESGSGISWKEKKKKEITNKVLLMIKFIYSVTCY